MIRKEEDAPTSLSKIDAIKALYESWLRPTSTLEKSNNLSD